MVISHGQGLRIWGEIVSIGGRVVMLWLGSSRVMVCPHKCWDPSTVSGHLGSQTSGSQLTQPGWGPAGAASHKGGAGAWGVFKSLANLRACRGAQQSSPCHW